jgi:hypothetical protein
VTTTQQADGSWRTRIEVRRAGDNYMPVDLLVSGVRRRLDSRERVQVVTIDTGQRPAEVVLDPEFVLIDVNPDNNRKSL